MTESVVLPPVRKDHAPSPTPVVRRSIGSVRAPCLSEVQSPDDVDSIERARADVDLHTFECAVCNHVLTTLAAYEDPMHSKALGRYLQGDLQPLR